MPSMIVTMLIALVLGYGGAYSQSNSQGDTKKEPRWKIKADKKKDKNRAKRTNDYEVIANVQNVNVYNSCKTPPDPIPIPGWFQGDITGLSKQTVSEFKKKFNEEIVLSQEIRASNTTTTKDLIQVKTSPSLEDARKSAWQNCRQQFFEQYFERFKAIATVAGSKILDKMSIETSFYDWVTDTTKGNSTPIYVVEQTFFEDICPDNKAFVCYMLCHINKTLMEERLKELEDAATNQKANIQNSTFEKWFKEWEKENKK